ncbi:Alcohol dehydrogenase GroES-like domain family protein [Clavispora lusitaniae]|uniref:Alcohol dehydrogenase GroES-like domain family protein n=1 Tax=Clavispora lusitaniae TaxID=36911 RepID=UPI0016B0104D|nr:hypothetical protein E0198_003564 [Clavispora lusitaniae]KAF7582193.1 Alcohol dehydrogenase GroES-like domain family protein [Clavispora lusitaniae]
MRAVVFKKPFCVETVSKPIPELQSATDALVKVKYSGICGSDLHYYRGHIPSAQGQTMGHEFVGTVVAKGSEISDSQLTVGDEVISTFTIQCGQCWYCKNGLSGTCDKTNTFGKTGLQGAQAEYVLVPYATSTLIKKPQNGDSNDAVYTLMADIFVTAYFGVKKVRDFFSSYSASDLTILQMGAGPVGLCAVAILAHYGFKSIVVVDGIEDRLEQAKQLGASEVVNFHSGEDKLDSLTAKLTESRGYDAVLEIVGATSAMKTAFDHVRRGGFISSVGMGHEGLPFDALQCYAKCLTVSFGRCNTWSLFEEALELFEVLKSELNTLIDATPSIEEAAEYYERFERGEVKKVVLKFE